MGCTCDCINMKLQTEEMALEAIEFFLEILDEELYYGLFDPDDLEVEEKEDGFWIYIEGEPLFNTWESGEQINHFVEEFIKKFPNEYFYLNDTTSFNNCGDTTYYEFTYDAKKKELTIRTVFADCDGLYICPECQEDFEGEPLVYIEDYKKGEKFTCPLCGAEIEFDAEECVEKIKLEDI